MAKLRRGLTAIAERQGESIKALETAMQKELTILAHERTLSLERKQHLEAMASLSQIADTLKAKQNPSEDNHSTGANGMASVTRHTLHGLQFETALYEYLRSRFGSTSSLSSPVSSSSSSNMNDKKLNQNNKLRPGANVSDTIIEALGTKTGLIRNCKVGSGLLSLRPYILYLRL